MLKRGKLFYIAVSNPQNCSKRCFILPDRPVHSNTISASLGSIQLCAAINARRLRVHISTTVYSQVLIYTAEELEQCRVKKLAQGFNTAANDANPGTLSRESEVLPLSHCALNVNTNYLNNDQLIILTPSLSVRTSPNGPPSK